jgi:hypothetical protein
MKRWTVSCEIGSEGWRIRHLSSDGGGTQPGRADYLVRIAMDGTLRAELDEMGPSAPDIAD